MNQLTVQQQVMQISERDYDDILATGNNDGKHFSHLEAVLKCLR